MKNKLLMIGVMSVVLMVSLTTAITSATSSVEIRGSPVDSGDVSEISWNAIDWSAFYYSVNEIGSNAESLYYENTDSSSPAIGASPGNNVMDEKELVYVTHTYGKKYMVSAKTDVAEVNTYSLIPFFGQKFVAVDGDAQKMTKMVLEQKGGAEKRLREGESWDLGKGYSLTLDQLDVDGGKVLLTLHKNGVELDSDILDMEGTDDDRTFISKADFAGKEEAVYFVAYVDNTFRCSSECFATLKYTWLIDKDDVTTIEKDDELGVFKCTEVSEDVIVLSNDEDITLELDDSIYLTDDWYFKVSKAGKGTDGGYLFYPAKKVTLETKTTTQTTVEEMVPEKDVEITESSTAVNENVSQISEEDISNKIPVQNAEKGTELALKVEDNSGLPAEDSPGFAAFSTLSGILAALLIIKRRFD